MRLTTFFVHLVLTLCAALSLSAESVRVIFVTGQAQIQGSGETTFRPLVNGQIVKLGDRIVTGADGRVALTPLPGVKALITPNTDLLLENASEIAQANGSVAAAATLDLKQGAVVTDILKQDGVSYDYNVRTPRGLAGARGTNYTVGVNAAGIETVLVSEGTVVFNLLDGRQLSVTTGQVTISDASGNVRQAASIEELSAADQAFAQEIAEATLKALENALATGVEINPAAIGQALQLFDKFGLDVSNSTLQVLGRLQAALETLNTRSRSDSEIATIITEQRPSDDDTTGPHSPYDTFVASLDQTQLAAFTELTDRGGFDSNNEIFRARFSNSTFVTSFRATISLYASLSAPARDQAVSLGILGDQNETAIGANSAGLARLIQGYTDAAPTGVITQLDEADFATGPITASAYVNNFFSGASAHSGQTVFNALFGDSGDDSDLTVGATRYFRLENNASFTLNEAANFEVADGRDIIVRAADEVALTGTGTLPITFGSSARGVLIESVTINLANVNFTEGSVIVLTSRDGGASSNFSQTIKIPNFGSSKIGRVNFLGSVFYGDNLLNNDEAFILGSRGNIHIAAFADSPNPTFPAYTLPEPTAEELFAGNLPTDQQAVFNNLPSVVRQKFVALNDSDITGVLLSPDPESAVIMTATDTERVLDSYSALSPNARAFFKSFAGGTGLPNIQGSPDFKQWSPAAIEAAATTFNSLGSNVQNTLITLGAGDAIIGLNADYIEGLTVVTAAQTTAIAESGWGRYLEKLVADAELLNIDDAATGATAAQRNFIRLLRIDPYELVHVLKSYDNDAVALYARIDLILGNVSSPDLELLSQIGFRDTFTLFSASDPVTEIQTILSNYNGLSSAQQTAARALGIGSVLSDATRAVTITDFYLGLDLDQQEAMRDADLVQAFYTGTNDSAIQTSISSAITAFLNLDPLVKNYLLDEADSINLVAVLNSDSSQLDNTGKSLRPLSEIVSLIQGIANTPADLEALRDLDLGHAILFDGYLDAGASSPADAVRNAITFFRALTPAEQGTMRSLGIVGETQVGFLGSDYSGVTRLLKAYASLPTALRVNTLQLSEDASSNTSYDQKASYFLPDNQNYVMEQVSFASNSDLYVGAVRRLRIDNSLVSAPADTFVVNGDHTSNIHLRAGDLIDLNNTPIASNARGITMEAITINLANIHFADGSTAALNSRDGTLNFGSSVIGGVNFLSNVTYGGAALDNAPNFNTNSRGNIGIGSFAAPAALPNYVP